MKTHSIFLPLFKSIRGNKRKTVLLLLLPVLLWINASAQNSVNIVISPSTSSVQINQIFTVNVLVDFGTGTLAGVDAYVNFNQLDLAVQSTPTVPSGTSTALPNTSVSFDDVGTMNTSGHIDYGRYTTSASNHPNSDFVLFTITFKVLRVPPGGNTTITFNSNFPRATAAGEFGQTDILDLSLPATINIQNCTQPTATIAGPSASSICNGQPVSLRLSAATGVGPYTLVIDGTPYSNVTVGSSLPSIPFPTYSIWPSNPVPDIENNDDGTPIEVGTKFRSTAAGFVKGIRLYIGSTSTGTAYTGKLWNATTGTLMASATFTPGSSGWQQVTFTSPVAIAANTTYIASYYSASGRYSNTDFYFCASGSPCVGAVTNGPLTALADGGVGGANGVYRYGAGGGLPINSSSSANYWADVVFTQNTNSFHLESVTDATGCINSGALQTLNLTSVDCSSLPVSLLGLSATPNGRKVTLHWTTSTEINNVGFDVQRSNDGVNWTKIGFVAGAGNSSVSKNYNYVDDNLEPRRYYYRLNQMDIDGRSKYSVVVIATIGGKSEYTLGQNYPNPFRNETTIQYTLPQAGQVNLSLFDVSGRTVKVLVNASKEAGTHAINLNTGTLTRGIYYYRLQAGDFTDVKKLTIQ